MEEQNKEVVQEQRDFAAEAAALYEAHPELRQDPLPEEVARACVEENKPLTEAYDDYARRQRQDAQPLRRELRVQRPAAPVRGVTQGGSAAIQPEDPFLRGFNQEW